MKALSLGVVIVLVLVLLVWFMRRPPAWATPDAQGIIHHPRYGDYPATVPFKEGMTIMPRQTAIASLEIPLSKGMLEAICLDAGEAANICAKYREGGERISPGTSDTTQSTKEAP